MKETILLLFCVGLISGFGGKCSNCLPKAHLRVYERRACQPIIAPFCNCPLYYNCSPEVVIPPLPEVEKLKLKLLGENACIIDDKVFAIEEDLQIPCRYCQCESSKTTRNVSGHVIKGSAFGMCWVNECFLDREVIPAGCHETYFDEKCQKCGTGQICAGHQKADFRCKVGEKTYRYEEKIEQIPEDLCKICLCDEMFDVNNLEQSNCWQKRCYPTRTNHHSHREGIDESGVLMQHCTPVYYRTSCCPWDFICDEDFKPEAGIFKAPPTNLNDTCVLRGQSYKIGEKVNFRLEDTFYKYFDRSNGMCTCRIPPLMTCYYDVQ